MCRDTRTVTLQVPTSSCAGVTVPVTYHLVRRSLSGSEVLLHPAAKQRHWHPHKFPWQLIVQRRPPTGKSPPSHLRARSRDIQSVVPTSGPLGGSGLCHGRETSSQLRRLTKTTHFVREAQSVVCGHALRAEPPQSFEQIRNVVILPAAEQYFGCVVNDFLKPTEVTLFAVPVN